MPSKLDRVVLRQLVRRVPLPFLVVAGLYLYVSWTAPYRVMKNFVAAVERRDAKTILALSHPLERERANLTEAGIGIAIRTVFPIPVRKSGEAVPAGGRPGGWRGDADRTSPDEGTLCQWNVGWSDHRSGQPLLSGWTQGPSHLSSPIILKPSDRGWRVLVGEFFQATCRAQRGSHEEGSRAFAYMARQADMRGYIDTAGDLRDLERLWITH